MGKMLEWLLKKQEYRTRTISSERWFTEPEDRDPINVEYPNLNKVIFIGAPALIGAGIGIYYLLK